MGILALPLGTVALALTSAAMFGATYMALTGLCIIWAARLFPEVPARGVTLSFLGLGIGQTVGAPVAGAVADLTGLGVVFAGAAFVSLAAAYQLHPQIRLRETPQDGPRELTGTGGRTSVPGA